MIPSPLARAVDEKTLNPALSLRLSVVNLGISLDQLGKGSPVLGSVVSSEDHGYVVSFGSSAFNGFLPRRAESEAPEV